VTAGTCEVLIGTREHWQPCGLPARLWGAHRVCPFHRRYQRRLPFRVDELMLFHELRGPSSVP
jgi:hypothetical protein